METLDAEALPHGSAVMQAALPSETGPPQATQQLPRSLFREHFARLWRLVARLGVPLHSVDDVVQETFIAASRRHVDIVAGQEKRFLIGTAIKVSANYRQRAHVRHEVQWTDLVEERPTSLPNAEQLLQQKRERMELEAALDSLTADHRNVFVLYELEGFSAPEIAALLGLPLGTVASRLARARSHFSRCAARLQRAAAKDSEAR